MSTLTKPSKPRAQHTNTEENMYPKPVYERDYDRQGKKLSGKAALITGGDSGIGMRRSKPLGKMLHPNGGSIVNT